MRPGSIPGRGFMNSSSRKNKTRREFKRIERKQERQAEAQALRGDHQNQPYGGDPIPLDMAPAPKRGKKSPKQVDYCPAREGQRRHEYLEEERSCTYFWRVPVKHTRIIKMCVHCGKEKSKRRFRKGWL